MTTSNPWTFRIPQPLALVCAWAFTLHLLVGGIDYAAGDHAEMSARWTVVEAALPIWVWGMFYILTALLSAYGLLAKKPRAFMLAAACATAIYAAMAVGLFIWTIQTPPPLDGIRTVTRMLAGGVTWACFGYGTKLQLEIDRRAAMLTNQTG